MIDEELLIKELQKRIQTDTKLQKSYEDVAEYQTAARHEGRRIFAAELVVEIRKGKYKVKSKGD